MLGVRRVDGKITLAPTLPSEWPSCRLVIRDRGVVYRVQVNKRRVGHVVIGCTIDGVEAPVPVVLVGGDRREVALVITLD
jgi:cyclic beta-1,2-glucan synthetase